MKLGVSEQYLKSIKQQNSINHKIHIFAQWLVLDVGASWSKLIAALKSIGYTNLSETLSNKYNNGKLLFQVN